MAEVSLTAAQSGQTVRLTVGDTLRLELPENPSTGYRWAIGRIDDRFLAIKDSGYHGDAEPIGSGGRAVWMLRAQAHGKTALDLKLWRHWEGDRSVIERFAVTLDIRAA